MRARPQAKTTSCATFLHRKNGPAPCKENLRLFYCKPCSNHQSYFPLRKRKSKKNTPSIHKSRRIEGVAQRAGITQVCIEQFGKTQDIRKMLCTDNLDEKGFYRNPVIPQKGFCDFYGRDKPSINVWGLIQLGQVFSIIIVIRRFPNSVRAV